MKVRVALTVNDEVHEALVPVHKTLLEVLREDLGLTGTKHGCELGECGTCTVLVDGRPVLSCLVLTADMAGKRIETVPATTMRKLMSWHWPGNVRELENLIERSVILTTNSVLAVSLPEKMSGAIDAAAVAGQYQERAQIVSVLKETKGRVSGPNGAAMRLGVKRSTLLYRMERLGINARDMKAGSHPKID